MSSIPREPGPTFGPSGPARLGAIAQDGNADTLPRYVAARQIGEMATDEAVAVLVELTRVAEDKVVVGALEALGRVGGEEALPAVVDARRGAGPSVVAASRFAAALISYRLGRAGAEPAWPRAHRALSMPRRHTRRFTIQPMSGAERAGVRSSFRGSAYGVDIGHAVLHWAGCDGAPRAVLILSPEAAGPEAPLRLTRRRTLLGLVAYLDHVEGRWYEARHVVFSRPRRGAAARLLVTDRRGGAAFAGELRAEGDGVSFDLWAVPRPRAAALEVEGRYDGTSIRLWKGRSSVAPQVPPRRPIPEVGRPRPGYAVGARQRPDAGVRRQPPRRS